VVWDSKEDCFLKWHLKKAYTEVQLIKNHNHNRSDHLEGYLLLKLWREQAVIVLAHEKMKSEKIQHYYRNHISRMVMILLFCKLTLMTAVIFVDITVKLRGLLAFTLHNQTVTIHSKWAENLLFSSKLLNRKYKIPAISRQTILWSKIKALDWNIEDKKVQ